MTTELMTRDTAIRTDAVLTGHAAPLGATALPAGVNFSVFSKRATRVDLLLFDRVDNPKPSRVVQFDPVEHRAYHYWNVFVPGVEPGQLYGFRAHGPFDPGGRSRFDSS